MADPLVIIDNAYATLRFHEAGKIIHHEMKQPIRAGAFQELLTAGLELMKKHHAIKWLSDDRQNSVLEPGDETWARTVWFPQAQSAGWKYWAVCPPAERVIGQLQINRHAKSYMQGGVEVKDFADPAEAMQWLLTLK